MRRARCFTLLGALLVPGFLAGCLPTEPPTGPGLVSIRAEGSGLGIGVCRATTVTGLRGEYRSGAVGDWVPFLEAHGSMPLGAGDSIDMAFVRENFEVTLLEDVPTSDVQIVVQVLGRGGTLTGIYEVTGTLSTEVWLHNDDTVTAESCA